MYKKTDDDRIKVASTSLDSEKIIFGQRDLSLSFAFFQNFPRFFLNRLHAVSTRRIDKKKEYIKYIYARLNNFLF